MKRILIAVTACVALLGGSAFAADLPPAAPAAYIPPPPPPPVFTWTGCYVGAGAGYAMWNQDAYTETYPGLTALTQTSTFGGRGAYGYGSVGCDYQITQSIVIGASGDYSLMNAHGQFTEPFLGGTGEETQSGMWAAGVRGGLLFTPNLLTYINGGWTGTRFNQINLTSTPNVVAGINAIINATTYNGWFLGGGTETSLEDFLGFRLPRGLFLRNEYRYTYYSAKDDPILTTAGAPTGGAVHVQKYDQMLTTAVVFKFNWQ